MPEAKTARPEPAVSREEPLRFDGQVAIVTGAGGGIGGAHARLLAQRGAHVVVSDVGTDPDGHGRDNGPAIRVVQEIVAAGGTAVANCEDVSSRDGARRLAEAAIETFGRLDIVVACASYLRDATLVEADGSAVDEQLRVDVAGPQWLVQAGWDELARQRGRVVLTMSSGAFGIAEHVAYCSGKAGAWGLAREIARRGADVGIKANVVAPFGFSRMTTRSWFSPEQVAARRRLAPPELVSPLIAVLAHPTCPATGEAFVAGAGRVTRLFPTRELLPVGVGNAL